MMPPKPSYKRGDVVLILYPNSDLRTAKTRPALIVQANNLQTGLSQVIVAMITSRLFRANHPSRVVVHLMPCGGTLLVDLLHHAAHSAADRVLCWPIPAPDTSLELQSGMLP
jgi:mRNA-degrading endonuclease toxin of MazEF toxin-antitoxin module